VIEKAAWPIWQHLSRSDFFSWITERFSQGPKETEKPENPGHGAMPEPAIHFSVPFAVLAFVGLDIRLCFLASAVALLLDLDVLFRRHRSATHSLLVYVPILALAFSLPSICL